MITRKAKPGKDHERSTSKPIIVKDRSQSVTNTRDLRVEPHRKAHERRGPWSKLANLLPPPPSRDQLRFLDSEPLERWRADCRTVHLDEFVNHIERSRLAQALGITDPLDLQLLHDDPDHGRRFVDLVAEIAATLQTLLSAASPKVLRELGEKPLLIKRLYETSAASWSEIWMHKGTVTTQLIDPFKDFLAALEGVEAIRVRQCPVCSRFFYAFRKDQKACSKRCNSARRVRDWRANQARHEYNRKLRGAGL
jgi:hypothetical protein